MLITIIFSGKSQLWKRIAIIFLNEWQQNMFISLTMNCHLKITI